MNSYLPFLYLVVDLPQERNNTEIDENTEYNLREDWAKVESGFVNLLHEWFRENICKKPNVVVFGNIGQIAMLHKAFNTTEFKGDIFVWVKSNRRTVQLDSNRILHYHEEFILIRRITPKIKIRSTRSMS